MIIDADTHIAPTGGDFGLDKHMACMERAGIDKTLVWLKPDYDGAEIERHNRYIYDAVQKYPDRLIGFGWAAPTVGVEHAIEMVRVCAEEYGLHGVKMNGAQNNYTIDDPQIALPVAEAIARMYPETPVLMVHMGMTDADMNRAVIEMAQQCPNMYLVGSSTTYKAVVEAINVLGAERVLFGTDDPFQWPHVVRAMYDAALDGIVSEEEKALVMDGNLARVLGL